MQMILYLPDKYIDLCEGYAVDPKLVITHFIADLCEIRGDGLYKTGGSDERMMAEAYFDRAHEHALLPDPPDKEQQVGIAYNDLEQAIEQIMERDRVGRPAILTALEELTTDQRTMIEREGD